MVGKASRNPHLVLKTVLQVRVLLRLQLLLQIQPNTSSSHTSISGQILTPGPHFS